MKACPTCKRTYADETLRFCLDDGSVLTSLDDQNATLQLPVPPPTQPPVRPPQPSTMVAVQQPNLYSRGKQQRPEEKQGTRLAVVIGIVLAAVGLVGAGMLLSFIWFGRGGPEVSQANTSVSNSNSTPDEKSDPTPAESPTVKPSPKIKPTPVPTATPDKPVGGWGPRQQASINEGTRITFYAGTTPDRCQADCDRTPKCRAFTYILAGAYNPTDPPMCYLMSQVKTVNPGPCCISAIKR